MTIALSILSDDSTNSKSELLATLSPLVRVHGSGVDKPALSESRKADVGFSGDWLGGDPCLLHSSKGIAVDAQLEASAL